MSEININSDKIKKVLYLYYDLNANVNECVNITDSTEEEIYYIVENYERLPCKKCHQPVKISRTAWKDPDEPAKK